MKIYIAAPWQKRYRAQEIMRLLEAEGHTVTSTWLKQDDALPSTTNDPVANDGYATLDLDDVAQADMLVALNPPDFEYAGTGGRHVEFGYAIALKKRIVLIGQRSNIFHWLQHVVVYEHVIDFLLAMASKGEGEGVHG